MRVSSRVPSPSIGFKRTILVVLLVVIVFLVSTARLFVWPPSDTPSRVDAIVALGGDPGQRRMKSAVQLAEAGYAPIVVISLGGDPKVRCPRTRKGIEAICFRPNPVDTAWRSRIRRQARSPTTLASDHRDPRPYADDACSAPIQALHRNNA